MSIGAICNRRIPTAGDHTSVLAAAQCMQACDERVLVVVDEREGRRRAVGIVTEHELASVIARGADPARLALKDIMRTDPGFVTEADDVFGTACWMQQNRLREAIVHDGTGRLAGLVTLDRLIEALAGNFLAAAGPEFEEPGAAGPVALH